MRYSKTTNGFYPEFVDYSDLPDDLVIISNEEYIEIMNALNSGLMLSCDEKGYPFATPQPPLTIEQKRATMTVSAARVRINLARKGILKTVNDAIMSLSDEDEIKIMWEFETTLHRLNPILNVFCTKTLKLTPEQIDALFSA